jgi:tetratricopeptide (TPR) repeat protein
MKQFIPFILVLLFLSCSNESKQQPDQVYNPEAIELNNKAVKLSQRFQVDSALMLYDQAIELDETYYLPHSNKVNIYVRRKEYDKALYEAEMAVKKKPDLAEAVFFAGLLNEKQGNLKKAKEYYLKSIEIFDNRIKNPEKKEHINSNKLNRALSKKFVDDETYIHDLNELEGKGIQSYLLDMMKKSTKQELMEQLLN